MIPIASPEIALARAESNSATVDQIRTFLGTPSVGDLTAASVAANLEFVRYLVDPHRANGKQTSFTESWRVELRNCVVVVSTADAQAPIDVQLTRKELAEFALGQKSIASANPALADLEASLDRSHLMPESIKSTIQLGVAAAVADRELSTQP